MEIHAEMTRAIEEAGGRLDGIYACPHVPEAKCACRKPRTGMIERACAELGLTAAGAPMVGDRATDVAAARRAGCRPVLVGARREGSPVDAEASDDLLVCRDLAHAADAILAERE